jgi:hypothetical protein
MIPTKRVNEYKDHTVDIYVYAMMATPLQCFRTTPAGPTRIMILSCRCGATTGYLFITLVSARLVHCIIGNRWFQNPAWSATQKTIARDVIRCQGRGGDQPKKSTSAALLEKVQIGRNLSDLIMLYDPAFRSRHRSRET